MTLLPSTALSALVALWQLCRESTGVLRVWKRRQDCSKEQLGRDLHADTGTWESLLSVMMQVRLCEQQPCTLVHVPMKSMHLHARSCSGHHCS